MSEREIDLVCQKQIYRHKAEHISNYNGVDVYFCSEECLRTFERDPTTYIDNLADRARLISRRNNVGWEIHAP